MCSALLPLREPYIAVGKERKYNTVCVQSHHTLLHKDGKEMKLYTGEADLITENYIYTLEVNNLHLISGKLMINKEA